MKKITTIAFLVLFFLASCAQTDGPNRIKTPFGFLIEYPSTYRIKNADSSMLRIYENIDDLDGPRFSIYPTEPTDEDISGMTKERMIEIIEESYQISEIGNFENTAVNGVQIVSIDVMVEENDGFIAFLKQAYFSVDGKIYLFIALTEGEDFSSLDKFAPILYSVQFS